jgi:hypothetical protein
MTWHTTQSENFVIKTTRIIIRFYKFKGLEIGMPKIQMKLNRQTVKRINQNRAPYFCFELQMCYKGKKKKGYISVTL